MGQKSYEYDSFGRITIYPSLERAAKKGPGLIGRFVNKVLGKKGDAEKKRS